MRSTHVKWSINMRRNETVQYDVWEKYRRGNAHTMILDALVTFVISLFVFYLHFFASRLMHWVFIFTNIFFSYFTCTGWRSLTRWPNKFVFVFHFSSVQLVVCRFEMRLVFLWIEYVSPTTIWLHWIDVVDSLTCGVCVRNCGSIWWVGEQ